MKHTGKIAVAVITAIAMGACTRQKSFAVDGKIEGAQDSMLYLYNKSLAGAVLLDSFKLDEGGQYHFKVEAPEAPDFYVLRIHDQIINFSVDSTETVTINAHYPGIGINYTVTGSDNNEKIRQLALMQSNMQQQLMALERDRSISQEQRIDSMLHLIDNYKETVKRDYIFVEPQKAYAYFALFQTIGQWSLFERSNPRDVRAFGAVATCWDTFYPSALRTEHLCNTTLKGMNEHRAMEARQNQTLDSVKIIMNGLIELELPDVTGRIRTLGELKGQVVLLDFHSYAMEGSAARILELRELYNKYHSQGLEIYQVGLDVNEHFWKQQTEKLPWICVFDPEATSLPQYNVRQLPESFSIDRQNSLQKRSSQMNDLETEIRQLL